MRERLRLALRRVMEVVRREEHDEVFYESLPATADQPAIRLPRLELDRRAWTLLAIEALLLGILGILLFARQPVGDWIYFLHYRPSPQVRELAVSFSEEGQRLFYRTDPRVVSHQTLQSSCPSSSAGGYTEVGCFVIGSDRIFLASITDPHLAPQMEVTAAHEMLHMAYSRLPDNERKRIDQLLEQEATRIHSPDLQLELQDYAVTEPGARDDELHSILATEYERLSPQLESYYSRYFEHRSQIARGFVAVNDYTDQAIRHFAALRNRALVLSRQADLLRTRGDSAYGEVSRQAAAAVGDFRAAFADLSRLNADLTGQPLPGSLGQL